MSWLQDTSGSILDAMDVNEGAPGGGGGGGGERQPAPAVAPLPCTGCTGLS